MTGFYTVLLLMVSNVFMTFAWYGHLKLQEMKLIDNWPLIGVILFSWGIALFEYSHRFRGQRRPLQPRPAQGDTGSGLPDRLLPVHDSGLQGPDLPLEPHRRLRLPGPGCLLRVHEIIRISWNGSFHFRAFYHSRNPVHTGRVLCSPAYPS